jgi:N-acyl-D-amino-acid deacylase
MTAVAANEVLCYDRGRLSPGLPADVIVFDYAVVTDRATFAEPHKPAEGMRYVIVNGQLVLEGAQQTAAKPGRVLRGPGYKP